MATRPRSDARLVSLRGMKLLLAYARPGYIRAPQDTPAFAGEHASENAIMPSGVPAAGGRVKG